MARSHPQITGIVLVVIGLVLLVLVFYEALTVFFAVGSQAAFEKHFGGALGYLSSLTSSSGIGQLGVYANVIIVLLIMAVFLGIALAAASVILAKGVELLRS
ncbi:MAG: hypothetical protein ACP5HK_04260 [Acidilobus sp.]